MLNHLLSRCAAGALRLLLGVLTATSALACSSGADPGAGAETTGAAEGPEGVGGAENAGGSESAGSATRMENGFFMAEGAPPPQACSADSDCTGNTVAAAGGCCQAPHPIRPHSRAYASWVSEWRAAHCREVQCPPPPAPNEPNECHFQLRCEAGQCADACP